MIYITLALRNPFSKRFDMVKNMALSISKNKTIEFGINKTSTIVGAGFYIDGFKSNHAGFGFDLELLGYQIDFAFYDNRHYDQRH